MEEGYEGGEVADTTVDNEVLHGTPEVAKGGSKLVFLSELFKVDFEDTEGLDASEVGEPFESVLVLRLVGWGVAQPFDIRRQYFSSFFCDVLAPSFEPGPVLEVDMVEQVTLAPRKPRFGNESAEFDRGAEVAA